jgi:hypothetical protein
MPTRRPRTCRSFLLRQSLARRSGVGRRDRRRGRAEPAVVDAVRPRAPGDGDRADEAVTADRDRDVEQRGRVGGLVVRDAAERQHAERLAVLDARQACAASPSGTASGRRQAIRNTSATASCAPLGEPVRQRQYATTSSRYDANSASNLRRRSPSPRRMRASSSRITPCMSGPRPLVRA